MSFGYLFGRLARWHGDRTAIVDQTGAWTFRTIGERINRLANALLGLGLETGDRVAILQGDTREHLESEYAAFAAGLVRVPLDPRLTPHELAAILGDAAPKAAIVDAALVESFQVARREVPSLRFLVQVGAGAPPADGFEYEALIQAASRRLDLDVSPDALASLNYSGGTTGQPKAIALTQRNLITVLQNRVQARSVVPGDVFLNVRPLWPIAAVHVHSHFVGGATIVLGGRFDPERFFPLLVEHHVNYTSLVPTQIIRLLAHGSPAGYDLSAFREIACGGSALNPSVFAEALDVLGPRISVTYGLAEAPATCYLAPGELATPGPRRDRLMRTVGRESFAYEVRVVDEADQPLPAGQTGEVAIRGDNVMRGYWNQPELSAQALRGGWLHTGDLGQLDDEGYLSIVGRIKEVIRSGSTSIFPGEVEEVLLKHPAVAEAAVLGVPDHEWGEVVKAVVVLRDGAGATPDELIEFCRQHLASFKKPRIVQFAASLPRSHYGKVLKVQLRQG